VQQLQTQRSLVAQLQGTVAADLAALDRDQVQLGYATITAPMSGVLGLRLVDVGNLVNPSDPAGLVVLTQVQPITVLFALPQANLNEIQTRQAATGGAGLTVQAWTEDGTNQLDEGRLSALSNQVDATSGAITLKGVFPNPKQMLWPGASVTVKLMLDTQHDGLTVPVAAIDQGPQGPFVWLIAADGTAHPTAVTLRQQVNGQALLSSGVKPRDQVVINGQYGLTSGAHVSVQKAQAQSPAANGNGTPLQTNQPNRLGISQ
jgi:multidrug efflux system membrane fusion protein